MDSEHNQHDDAVDKVLAALREAAPPEGMQERIAQRLANHATSAPTSARNWLAGSTFTGAWWRGAIAGAAAATLAICAVLLVQHRSRTAPAPIQTAAGSNAYRSFSTRQATPTSQSRSIPCAHTTVFRVDTSFPAKPQEDLRTQTNAESNALSRPAPELPMTPQERSLARLAHTADPRELASLSPEIQARREAEDAAAFRKFFTPPPPPPVPERIPDVTPEETQPVTPEVAPPATE